MNSQFTSLAQQGHVQCCFTLSTDLYHFTLWSLIFAAHPSTHEGPRMKIRHMSLSKPGHLSQEVLLEVVSYVERGDVISMKRCSRELDARIDMTNASKSITLRNYGWGFSLQDVQQDGTDWSRELGRRTSLLTQLQDILQLGRMAGAERSLACLESKVDHSLLLLIHNEARDVAYQAIVSIMEELLPLIRNRQHPNPLRVSPRGYALPRRDTPGREGTFTIARLMILHANHNCDLGSTIEFDMYIFQRLTALALMTRIFDFWTKQIVTTFWHLKALKGSLRVDRRQPSQYFSENWRETVPGLWYGSLGRQLCCRGDLLICKCQRAATGVMRLTFGKCHKQEMGNSFFDGTLRFDCDNQECRQVYWVVQARMHEEGGGYEWNMSFEEFNHTGSAGSNNNTTNTPPEAIRAHGVQPFPGRTVVVGTRQKRLPSEPDEAPFFSFAFWPAEQCQRISNP